MNSAPNVTAGSTYKRSQRGRLIVVAIVVVAVAGAATAMFLRPPDSPDLVSTEASITSPASTTPDSNASAVASRDSVDSNDSGQTSDGSVTDPSSVATDDANTDEIPDVLVSMDAMIAVEPSLPPSASGSRLGSRDDQTVELLVAELQALGVDLIGIEISVFKIIGTPNSLVSIHVNEATVQIDSDDESSEQLAFGLIGSEALSEANVTEMAMHVIGDDDGPYVLTMSLTLADLEAASTGQLDLFDQTQFQLVRGSQ